ncbi:MAG: hypothetical protein ACYC7A_02960 [Thermoanaerobaculia bacterium]
MQRRFVLLLSLAFLFNIPAAAEEVTAELQATVPELTALHDVVVPLWHDAWPGKNVDLVKQLLSDLRKGVNAIASATLPGILRDKADAWKSGVAALETATAACEKAASSNDTQGMLNAVEKVHAEFEGLVRVVKPPMKELDAYHQTLYSLYHKALPAGDLAAIRAAASELGAKCEALTAAPLPRRATGREENVKGAIASLCAATAELRAVPADANLEVLKAAVEKLHSAYQAAEAAFE